MNITLRAMCPNCQKVHIAEMPGVTSAKYGAKRLAEAIGLEPSWPWSLASATTHRLIDDDTLVSEIHGEVLLVMDT